MMVLCLGSDKRLRSELQEVVPLTRPCYNACETARGQEQAPG